MDPDRQLRHPLKKLPSISLSRSSSISSSASAREYSDDELRYTSLRDIMVGSPTSHGSTAYDGYEFDPSSITIRNQLVKHAASAYVSATIISSRNRSCFQSFWEKVKNKVASFSWRCAARVWCPLGDCFRPVCRYVSRIW